jgi:hypothetical protein
MNGMNVPANGTAGWTRGSFADRGMIAAREITAERREAAEWQGVELRSPA